MAQPTQIMFSHRELLELMIKKQDLHEGFWMIAAEFQMMATIAGPNDAEMFPTAMLAVSRMGLQSCDALNNLSLDAAVVNPKTITEPTKKPAKKIAAK